MTEPIPPTQVQHESLGYQPISGWAISGFTVGALFALLVAVCAAVAVYLGAPVFFPMWILFVAIAGGVLSWIGLTHVQNSEGTRAGAQLARAGVWLSLVSGLCYFSYWYFTGRALQDQANAFLTEIGDDSGFFTRLQKGAADPLQLNAAFLLTLPAVERQKLRPDSPELRHRFETTAKDGSPGKLTVFRDHVFVRLLDLPHAAEVVPMAVQDWSYAARKYQVKRIYRVKTKEVTIDLFMTVERTEGESAGESSKWFVNLNESGALVQGLREYTPVGKALQALRGGARDGMRQWIKLLDDGKSAPFADLDQTQWKTLRLADADRAKNAITKAFVSTAKHRFFSATPTRQEEFGRWEQTPAGKIRVTDNLRFPLIIPGGDGAGASMSIVDCRVILETRQAVDLERFDPAAAPLDWDVIRIVIVNVSANVSPHSAKG